MQADHLPQSSFLSVFSILEWLVFGDISRDMRFSCKSAEHLSVRVRIGVLRANQISNNPLLSHMRCLTASCSSLSSYHVGLATT